MSFEKVVKLACKPKAAPPKAKYIDAIITATYADDGSVHDICRALAGRLKEPSSIVVFKALITLHQMIRSGSTDNILGYLSQQDILRLRNVSSQPWEGYSPPSNLIHYARYLDVRIRGYRELKHDPVRVQADSNRMSKYEGTSAKARKLRQLTVDKGLLREVKQVQRMIDSLLDCKFYDDDLHDECTVVALRMLLKDLLVMFQAGNEGVINVLEHYFEMSKVDATDALAVYKSFCKQTDNVVEYLSMARKLVNLLNVPVPNLKHAPVSLAKALEEYLEDPNFEQNRLEYKANMSAVDGLTAAPSANRAPTPTPAHQPEKPTPASNSSTTSTAPLTASGQQAIQDFFESIQADQQPTMFSHQTGTGGYLQNSLGLQAQFNPFRQSTMQAQATGFMNMQPQMTGYSQGMPFQQQGTFNTQNSFGPSQQHTFMASNVSAPAWQSTGPSSFIQPQHTTHQTHVHQPLQAQPTGSNPFRQSTFFSSAPPSQSHSPLTPAAAALAFGGGTTIHQQTSSFTASSPGGNPQKPLLSQPTGSKNPFALPVSASAPPVPTPSTQRGLSLRELAIGGPSTSNSQSWLATSASNFGTVPPSLTSGDMSGIASAFIGDKPTSPSNADGVSMTGRNWTNRVQSSPETPTGQQAPATAGFQPQRTGFLQPQQTGFTSNVKPFKPTSHFGSTLVESLPPIDQVQSQQTGYGQLQTTELDTQANPFRKPVMGGAGPAGLPSAFAVSGHGHGPSGTNNAFNSFNGLPASGQSGQLL